MPGRSTASLEDFSATIESIYAAATDATLWPSTLKRVADLLGGMFASISYQGSSGLFPNYQSASDGASEIMEPYARYYQHVDPVIAAASRMPVFQIVTDRMVIPKSEAVRTEIYSDFARPRGIGTVAHAFPFRSRDMAFFVAVCRSTRAAEFERIHIKTLGLLLPHLGRAMSLHMQLERAHVHLAGITESFNRLDRGIIVVSKDARVLFANHAAEELFRRNDGIGADASGLHAATRAQTASLRRLIASAADPSCVERGGGALRLYQSPPAFPLSAVVMPLNGTTSTRLPMPLPAAIVFVGKLYKTTRIRSSRLRELYDLTATEAEVAAHIARGQGVIDTATKLSVAPSTIRWHLKHIFDKTGTARQAELPA